MDPERIMDSLFKELTTDLRAMSKAQTLDEKIKYSQIVNNLCESLGVFLNLASDMMGLDLEE